MRVIRSAGQNVSPSDDGRLFDQAFSDGLFEDATIAANGGNSIAIGALYGIICGRDFTAEAQTIAATLPESDTATGYVYVEIDTSSDDIITIGTALEPFTPTYEDINTNGAVVQMIIAQYEASAVAVTSVMPTYTTASAGAVDAGSVATIETSPTVAAHAVGDIILYGGKIYEVTAAISIGESLVIGTNIVATSIGDEISALNAGLNTWNLLAQASATTTEATVNLTGGSFSDYKSIIFVGFNGSARTSLSAVMEVPTSIFTSIDNVRLNDYVMNEYHGGVVFTYVNDTQVKVRATYLTGWTSVAVSIYGKN